MKAITPLVFAVVLLLPKIGFAAPTIADNFVRTGQNASFAAPLTTFGGVTAPGQWSGLIEVILSGDAVNNPPTGLHVDPFWAFSPSNPSATPTGTGTRFRLSFTGCATSFECGAPDIVLFAVFAEGIGPVTPPNLPSLDPLPIETAIPILNGIVPYNTAHTYHFVIDVGSTPRTLTLGDGDGGVFDNSGQFQVQLFSVTEQTATPPFSRAGVRCQTAIGEAAVQQSALIYTAHAVCLTAEASGKTCNIKLRDATIKLATAATSKLLAAACTVDSLHELGFGGTFDEIVSRLSQSAIDSAMDLIHDTYPANYTNKP
ncbi:MAG TPA: hypothetical protein VGH16_08790 [Candidatus Binatia bacterium]|jgi:hypothetical protein